MRQILYVSRAAERADQATLDAIIQRSRHNNALDGVTGLLWTDGDRFVQVIEGDDRAVGEAIERISADPRRRDVEVLHDRSIVQREFGDWSMELRVADAPSDGYDARMLRALEDASAAVRELFASLIARTAS